MFTTVDPRLLERGYIRTAMLTEQLSKSCRLMLGAAPVQVRRAVAPEAGPLRCFWNVADHAKEHGGEIVFGWSIHEWPHLFWEAQHHAVWRAPDGELIDITPPAAPGGTATLFVEDPSSAFDLDSGFGDPEDDQRVPLVPSSALRSYTDIGFHIRNRRHALPPDRHASDRMLNNYLEVQRIAKEAMMLELANRLDSDARCFCGSDIPFAQCCRWGFS